MRVTKRMAKRALKAAAQEFGPDWLKPLGPMLTPLADAAEVFEEHGIEPWTILRCVGRMEATACEWLERNGFECWYPKGRFIRTVPLRHLPSKTRHKRAQMEVVETMRAAYPGYVLVRRMFGDFDLNRLFALPGIIGICCFGERVAVVPDYDVELVRLDEARGRFDQFANAAAERAYFYKIAKSDEDKRYSGDSRVVGRACESGLTVTFQKTLGRVTRIIAASDLPEPAAR
jgi:hypothetical protein